MSGKIKVGLQLSVGGLGDKSFNDSAYAGILKARESHKIEFELVDWLNPMLNMNHLEAWAEADFDLIIGLGYGNAAPVSEIAARYPDTHFAVIDYKGVGPNVWSATYREYEGDFVVGVLAGLISRTKTVGFIGGGVTPVVHRIELGFTQGVEHMESTISFISDYVGEFDDPIKGRLLAETQYTLGVDVIYQVAGRCGIGAIEAAQELGKWIISTGGDHSDLAPKSVLTSRIKDVGKAVFDVITDECEGRFQGGTIKSYGFAEGGLVMAPIRPEVSEIVTPTIQEIVKDIQKEVIDGKIKVYLGEDD